MVKSEEGKSRPGRRPAGGPVVTRDRIVVAASRLFRQNGYDRTSIAAIAEEVGVTAPALYWHFSSKAEILFEFLRSTLFSFTQDVQRDLVGVHEPVDRLRAFAESHTRAQLQQYDVSVVYGELIYSAAQLTRSLEKDQLEELVSLQRHHLDVCRGIIRDGVEAGQFEVQDDTAAAFAVINICEYVTNWFNPSGRLAVDEVARLHGDFAVRMVMAGPAAPPGDARPSRTSTSPSRRGSPTRVPQPTEG